MPQCVYTPELRILNPFPEVSFWQETPRRFEVLLCFAFCAGENNEESVQTTSRKDFIAFLIGEN